jgi:hypothetical protein
MSVVMKFRLILAALALCGLLAVCSASAEAKKSCGTFRAHGSTYRVKVARGHVRCHRARHVLHDFFNGRGTMHGPANGPAYKQWWAVDGWRCGYGAGGGGCSRGRKLIIAEWAGG